MGQDSQSFIFMAQNSTGPTYNSCQPFQLSGNALGFGCTANETNNTQDSRNGRYSLGKADASEDGLDFTNSDEPGGHLPNDGPLDSTQDITGHAKKMRAFESINNLLRHILQHISDVL